MSEAVEHQLNRLKGLLNPERTRVTLQETDPEFPPEDFGALAAVGYVTPNETARISVYVFEDWSKHREVSKRLEDAYTDDDAMYVRTVTNGPMLMFARTPIEDGDELEARFRIGGIISAFAGDE